MRNSVETLVESFVLAKSEQNVAGHLVKWERKMHF